MNSIKLLLSSLLQFLKLYWKEIILFGVVLTFILCFVFWFVGQERTIYMYDYANYHKMFVEFGEKFAFSRRATLSWLIESIRNYEYNLLHTLFLFPFYYFFGDSRISFISAVSVIYAFPTIILFSLLVKKLASLNLVDNQSETENYSKIKKGNYSLILIPTIFLSLFPAFWNPTITGFPDVGGVGVIFFILILYFRKPLLKQNIFELIFIGLLLSFLILFRRWYAYWVVGFFVAATVYELLNYNWQNRNLRELSFIFRNIGIIGFTAVSSFFIIATPIALKMLTTDYSDLYSGYRTGFSPLVAFVFIGISLLAICLIGVIYSFFDKKLKPYSIFGIILFVTTYFLFTRTQDIHPQHLYWVISILGIYGAVLLCKLYQRLNKTISKAAFILILTLFGSLNFGAAFIPKVGEYLGSGKYFFVIVSTYPKIRNDLPQINELLKMLETKTNNSDKKVYVMTSSEIFSDDILKNGCDYFDPQFGELKKRILFTHQIDSRDGFPFPMLQSDYLVVTIPTNYLLVPDNHRVLGFLSEQIYAQKNIGNAFQKLDYNFRLDDGRDVYLYKKKRNFTEAELREISDIFVGFYPNKRENFEITDEMIKKLTN